MTQPRATVFPTKFTALQQLLQSLAVVVSMTAGITAGNACATVIAEPSSATPARNEALQAIPFDQLSPQVGEGIADVVNRSSFYRRLPTKRIQCDPDMYLFLLRNPDVIVNIWEKMGASDLQLKRTDALSFSADDGAGTTSSLKLIYGSPNIHVLYADSIYNGPLMGRPVKTRTVLVVRTTYERGQDGLPLATSTMDVFVRIDHVAAKIVARTMAPLVSQTADHNFVETIGFFQRLSKTAAENEHGMRRMAGQLDKIHPDVQQQFATISSTVAQRAQARGVRTDFNGAAQASAETTTRRVEPASTGIGTTIVPFAGNNEQSARPDFLPRRQIHLRR